VLTHSKQVYERRDEQNATANAHHAGNDSDHQTDQQNQPSHAFSPGRGKYPKLCPLFQRIAFLRDVECGGD